MSEDKGIILSASPVLRSPPAWTMRMLIRTNCSDGHQSGGTQQGSH